MGRRRRKHPLLEKVKFFDIGDKGKAVGKTEDKVVFAVGPIPGDVADIQVFKKRKNYLEGRVTQFHERSEHLVPAKCQHFDLCGGCKWQHMDYAEQVAFKEKTAKDALKRIGKVEAETWLPILKSESLYQYRNKLEYTFSEKRWLTEKEVQSENDIPNREGLGFHLPGKFDKVLHVSECLLQPNETNLIRNFLYERSLSLGLSFFELREQVGVLRNLVVRNNRRGEWMVNLVVTEMNEAVTTLLTELMPKFSFIKSCFYTVNTKRNDSIADLTPTHFAGDDHLVETFEDPKTNNPIQYKISPLSFFQTNSPQAERLYRLAYDFAEPSADDVMYDLYTGTGSIGLYFANSVKKVVGIEYVEDAIADAKENASRNQMVNTAFFAGDMKEVLTDKFVAQHGAPSLLLTDPPRAGMHEDVVNLIIRVLPEKVVYVSCNPATQARDLSLMSEHYNVIKSRAVDMFPHTSHVENVVLLKRKND